MKQLWLCLYLPQLALNVHTRTNLQQSPLVIFEGQGNQQTIISCNPAAILSGITPGMRLSAAYALTGELVVRERNPLAEQQALEHLAIWASQFTSWIQVKPPYTLLLEIQGSLRLFDGLSILLSKIQQGVTELGYDAQHALAQTPAAAELLARDGQEYAILHEHQLNAAVSKVAVHQLEVGNKTIEQFRGLGLRRVRDLLRLPRDGLTKRFGAEFVNYLDRLLGHAPDPRPAFRAPEYFRSRIEITFPVDKTEPLLFIGKRLLMELVGFLRSRGAGTQQLIWTLYHEKKARTHFELNLVEPSRDSAHLFDLLRERLERLSLAAPVFEVGLRVRNVQPLEERNEQLIQNDKEQKQENWQQLVERLTARMGEESVSGIQMVDDHRPEKSWRYCVPGESGPPAEFENRPLWLMEAPQKLEIRNRKLFRNGYLELLTGPERIQCGWWDSDLKNNQDIQRDYFIAKNTQGQRYWIFREIGEKEKWFVHGVF